MKILTKFRGAVRLAILLFSFSSVQTAFGTDDHGDSFAKATDIGDFYHGTSRSESASLSSGDVDVFQLELVQSGDLLISASGSPELYLYDASGSVIDFSEDGSPISGEDIPAGDYYVSVSGFSGTSSLNFSLEGRYWNSFMEPRVTYYGEHLSDGTAFGNVDYAGGSVSREFQVENYGDPDTILNFGNRYVYETSDSNFTVSGLPLSLAPGEVGRFVVTFTPTSLEEYSAKISIPNNSPTRSLSTFEFYVTGTGALATNDDFGDSRSSATLIGADSITSGRLDFEGDNDFFRIEVPSSGRLVIGSEGSTDTYGYLFNESGATIESSDDASISDINFGIDVRVGAGIYYVRVTGFEREETGDYQLNAAFTVDPVSLTDGSQSFDSIGGSHSFEVISGTSWSWSDDASWITTSEANTQSGDQSFSYSVSPNPSSSSRNATLTFQAGGISSTHEIIQSGAEPTLSLDDSSEIFFENGGAHSFSVSSNTEWSWRFYSDYSSWVSFNGVIFHDGDYYKDIYQTGNKTFSYSVRSLEYGHNTILSGTIYFKIGGETVHTHTITQSRMPFDLSDSEESFGLSGGAHSFTVESDASWNWSTDADWITSDESPNQSGDQSFTYSVSPNNSGSSRSSTITFTDRGITRSHAVNQVGNLGDEEESFAPDGGGYSFSVSSDSTWSWSLSPDASWVTSGELTTQSGDQLFTYSVSPNESLSDRSATISFMFDGYTSTHTVRQVRPTPPPAISLSDYYGGDFKTFWPSGGSGWIDVSPSSGVSWSSNASWLRLGSLGSRSTYYVDENYSGNDRHATVTFTGEGLVPKIYTVLQYGFTEVSSSIGINPLKDFDSAGGTNSFQVSSRSSWSWILSPDASWVTSGELTTQSGDQLFTYSVSPNDSNRERSTEIRFVSNGGDVRYHIIRQQGADTVLSVGNRDFDSGGGSYSFGVDSLTHWIWSADASWVTSSESSYQVGYATFSYSVSPNSSPSERSATITFTGPKGIPRTHTITQEGVTPTLSLTDSNESFGPNGGSHSFAVNSDTSWTWSDDASWVTSSESTTQSGNQTFSYSVSSNPTINSRTATITFTRGGITRTHTVSQDPPPSLSLSDSSQGFASEGGSHSFAVSSNTSWSWSWSDDASWVTSSESTTQSRNQTFIYSVSSNPTVNSRNATITFTGDGITRTHTISQVGLPLHAVTFELGDYGNRTGGGERSQTVVEGQAAVEPVFEVSDYFIFTGWDVAFDNITADLTVNAQYEADDDNDGIGNFTDPDRDGDEIDDQWELDNFSNLTTTDANSDYDGDGISDVEELNGYGTNPLSVDTDDDNISDALEVEHDGLGFDPLVDSSNQLAAYQEAAAELPGIYSFSDVGDLKLGKVKLTQTEAGVFTVDFVIEESEDLAEWTVIDTMSQPLGSSATSKFIRVRLLEQ
jgi:hypothetical protein